MKELHCHFLAVKDLNIYVEEQLKVYRLRRRIREVINPVLEDKAGDPFGKRIKAKLDEVINPVLEELPNSRRYYDYMGYLQIETPGAYNKFHKLSFSVAEMDYMKNVLPKVSKLKDRDRPETYDEFIKPLEKAQGRPEELARLIKQWNSSLSALDNVLESAGELGVRHFFPYTIK